MSVNHSTKPGGIIRIRIFSIFLNMEVCYVFSLESSHRGDPNKYTKYTTLDI